MEKGLCGETLIRGRLLCENVTAIYDSVSLDMPVHVISIQI